MTDVNYTPEFDPVDVDGDYGSTGGDITVPTFHDIKPFRFWCQKALPLVYDDSLSYYEVLCKVVSYLNNMMTDLTTGTGAITQFAQQFVINQQFLNNMAEKLGENTEELEDYINDRMGDFTDAYNELQDYVNQYFNNLDVQDEIDTKLDEMAESGQFNVLFDPVIQAWMEEETEYINTSIATQNSTLAQQNGRISTLEGRMDTFASLPSGSTSGNAELLDIRTNFLGETFGSAGDAVRASDFLASGFSSQPFEEEILTINVSSFGFFDVSAYKGGKYAIILNSYTDSLTETGQLYINSSASTTNATRLYDDTDETSGHEHVSDYINDYIETVTETFTQGYRILVTFSIPSDAEFTYIGLKYYKDLTGAIEPDYIGYATNWISIPVDPTLSIAGDSADAKATGDALSELNERIGYYKQGGTRASLTSNYCTVVTGIDLSKDTEYKVRFQFTAVPNNTVYCYLTDSQAYNVIPGSTSVIGQNYYEIVFTPTANYSNLTAKTYMGADNTLVGTSCTVTVETTDKIKLLEDKVAPLENTVNDLLPSAINNFKLKMPFAVGDLDNSGNLGTFKKRISNSEIVQYDETINIVMENNYRVGYCEFLANNSAQWHGWYNSVTVPKGTQFKLQCARPSSAEASSNNITDPYNNDIMENMTITGIPDYSVVLQGEINEIKRKDFEHNGLKTEMFMDYALWSQGVAHVDDWLVGFQASNDSHTNTATYTTMNYKNGYGYHSRGNHNLGHCASADYNSDTDTLIVANGTYAEGVTPTIYIVSNAKETVDEANDILVSNSNVMAIELDELDGEGCVACFGETSDIIYVMTTEDGSDYSNYPGKYVYKLVMGKGTTNMTSLYPDSSLGSFISGKESNEYNGTAYILGRYTGNFAVELQGMKYTSGKVCISCDLKINNVLTAYIAFLKVDETNSSVIIDSIYWIPSLAPNGSYAKTESEDVAFADGYGYVTYNRSVLSDSATLKFSLP